VAAVKPLEEPGAAQRGVLNRLFQINLRVFGNIRMLINRRPGYKNNASPATESKTHGGDQYRPRRI
jgi:hypothetical protein